MIVDPAPKILLSPRHRHMLLVDREVALAVIASVYDGVAA